MSPGNLTCYSPLINYIKTITLDTNTFAWSTLSLRSPSKIEKNPKQSISSVYCDQLIEPTHRLYSMSRLPSVHLLFVCDWKLHVGGSAGLFTKQPASHVIGEKLPIGKVFIICRAHADSAWSISRWEIPEQKLSLSLSLALSSSLSMWNVRQQCQRNATIFAVATEVRKLKRWNVSNEGNSSTLFQHLKCDEYHGNVFSSLRTVVYSSRCRGQVMPMLLLWFLSFELEVCLTFWFLVVFQNR